VLVANLKAEWVAGVPHKESQEAVI
jgi:hypothetical protein